MNVAWGNTRTCHSMHGFPDTHAHTLRDSVEQKMATAMNSSSMAMPSLNRRRT